MLAVFRKDKEKPSQSSTQEKRYKTEICGGWTTYMAQDKVTAWEHKDLSTGNTSVPI